MLAGTQAIVGKLQAGFGFRVVHNTPHCQQHGSSPGFTLRYSRRRKASGLCTPDTVHTLQQGAVLPIGKELRAIGLQVGNTPSTAQGLPGFRRHIHQLGRPILIVKLAQQHLTAKIGIHQGEICHSLLTQQTGDAGIDIQRPDF